MTRFLDFTVEVVIVLLALGQHAHSAEWNPTATDLNGNTAGGVGALDETTGTDSTAFGAAALTRNTTGSFNTASGAVSLNHNTSGSNNTANGAYALNHNDTGYSNTASGADALYSNTTGYLNAASGTSALHENTTGISNTASGYQSLWKNTTGHSNHASGYEALHTNTTGDYNSASGVDALKANTTGAYNTAFGNSALLSNTIGSFNIALDFGAGYSLINGSGNIYLGHTGVGTESNTLRLGSTQTQAFVAGVAETAVTGSAVFITGDGQLGVQVSSARYKQDIVPLGRLSEPLYQLRPVTFRYRNEPQGLPQYGLIAEEVAAVYPELVTQDSRCEVQGVRYEALIPLLLNELQHQQRQANTQAEQLSTQAQQMSAILEQLAELRAQNESLRAALGQPQMAAIAQSSSVAFDQREAP